MRVDTETFLKPCPFCGCEIIGLVNHGRVSSAPYHGEDDVWSIGCYGCGASVPNRYRKDLIVSEWNKRVSG